MMRGTDRVLEGIKDREREGRSAVDDNKILRERLKKLRVVAEAGKVLSGRIDEYFKKKCGWLSCTEAKRALDKALKESEE